MSGNLVSIMSAQVAGRGGRNAETLPRTRNKSYTISPTQNSAFRCTVCRAIMTRDCVKWKERPIICPSCFSQDTLVTVGGREIKARLDKEKVIDEITSIIKDNEPNSYSIGNLASTFNVTYPTMKIICDKLPDEVRSRLKLRQRKEPKPPITKQEEPVYQQLSEEEKDFIRQKELNAIKDRMGLVRYLQSIGKGFKEICRITSMPDSMVSNILHECKMYKGTLPVPDKSFLLMLGVKM